MSDTPRTDAFTDNCASHESLDEFVDDHNKLLDFTRQLERELAELKKDAERWIFCYESELFPRFVIPGYAGVRSYWSVVKGNIEIGRGDTPDEAVDAAISVMNEKK